jgi:Collagenase and related proteases
MAIELLSPAGNFDKLRTAFNFGADACYMGLDHFSLRANSENFKEEDFPALSALKEEKHKKLYLAMNILFHQDQIENAKELIPRLKDSPFDAFIISDMGLVPLLKKYCPDKELHLSTQASCLNSEAVKVYESLGFSRVILGREASIEDIKRIRDAVPDMEIECFVHGAMCMAYSGRCLLSSHLAGRSGNQGDCSHTCRWNYRLRYALEESEREGIYMPIEESEDGYTTILSSKDLCMIDHIEDLKNAGVSSLKIEGRMKSLYYVAVATRAYRKMLDNDKDRMLYREDLFNVSHREYSTGFFYSRGPIDTEAENIQTGIGYERNYLYLGTVTGKTPLGYSLDVRGQIRRGKAIEYVTPSCPSIADSTFRLVDENGVEIEKLDHGHVGFLQTETKLSIGDILRTEAECKKII